MAADIPSGGSDHITISAGEGSTLAGKNLTIYRIAEYPDVVMNGSDLSSVSARSVSNDTENWVKAALDAQNVNIKNGDNAASTLLRVKDNTNTIRHLAARLASTVSGKNLQKMTVTSNEKETTVSLPAGYSRPEGSFINVEVTDADGDVDFGYIRMGDDLNGFISKGNPRIFSVVSPAARTETVTVEIQPLDGGGVADLEEMYEGFSDENKPDKDAWMSGYKLNIR